MRSSTGNEGLEAARERVKRFIQQSPSERARTLARLDAAIERQRHRPARGPASPTTTTTTGREWQLPELIPPLQTAGATTSRRGRLDSGTAGSEVRDD